MYFYHPDHLGSTSYITDASGEVTQHIEYMAFGELFVEEGEDDDIFGDDEGVRYLFNAKELDEETGYYYYGARYYDARASIFLSVDVLADEYPSWSPYNYTLNNPVKSTDPSGMSTHTDIEGNVITVIDDGDLGVYRHPANADGGTPTAYMISKRQEKWGTAAHGEKMGETEYWDEFVNPETGKTMTETKIQFGRSFDPIIKKLAAKADDMDLREIAAESGPGGDFDIKVDYPNVGGLLNGKYATSRSAGNFLADYNAEGGTYFGVGISFETFQKLAGALHVEGSLTNAQKADIVINGTAYGPPPAYGEVMYQYRMSKSGWERSKSDRSKQ